MGEEKKSFKEQRVRNMTHLYYSRLDVQKAIFEFAKNREICPRYFDGFGKRPDTFQYPSDIIELVKKGATSFNCSEELWEDPLRIVTGMNADEANKMRIGWDLLMDVDSKYIDYSKVCAKLLISVLRFHGVKNIGIKFSGSKGFHLIIPWKAFPKEVNGVMTKDMFPEWPRILVQYLTRKIEKKLIESISDLARPNKYVKDFEAPKEVMPDLVLVSPRHLFRMPYSLHEKTALASVVLNPAEIENFELMDADPLKISVENFIPDVKEGEASELLVQALDWHKDRNLGEKKEVFEYKPIELGVVSEENFPPCVKKILEGMNDGKKRAVFILINLFRSIGLDRNEIESKISSWNSKNKPPLKEGYITSQLTWSYKNKPIMPQNCKDFYLGIGVCAPDEFCKRVKNPVNYVVKKTLISNKSPRRKK